MSLDFQVDAGTEDITLTETGDIATVTGRENVRQQITTVARRAVDGEREPDTAAGRARITGRLREQLANHPYVDTVGDVSAVSDRDSDDTVEVTVQVGSDESISTTA
jgi:hypothetical protein